MKNLQRGNMLINDIQNQRSNINFKQLHLDIGSSNPYCATVKRMVYHSGDIIDRQSGLLCPEGIKNEKSFVNRFVKLIKEGKKLYEENTKQKLKEVIIFTTGRPRPVKTEDIITYNVKKYSTIFKEDKTNLENVDFSPLTKKFKDVKISIFNDMHGAISAIISKLPKEEIPENGMVITTGGGFGTGYFKKIDVNGVEHIKTIESRDGNRLINKNGNDIKLEIYGASVRALIRNFCTELGFDEQQIQKYIAASDAKIVTLGNPDFIQENNLSSDSIKKASKTALDKYSEAIAHCVKLKVVDDNDKLDKIFLSGKLVDGLDNFIKENSNLWNKKDFSLEKLIKNFLYNDAGDINKSKIDDIKFSVISDIKDNTEGGIFLENRKYNVETLQERGKDVISILFPL